MLPCMSRALDIVRLLRETVLLNTVGGGGGGFTIKHLLIKTYSIALMLSKRSRSSSSASATQ